MTPTATIATLKSYMMINTSFTMFVVRLCNGSCKTTSTYVVYLVDLDETNSEWANATVSPAYTWLDDFHVLIQAVRQLQQLTIHVND